jgi:Plant protein of unknown function (DUF868)
MISQTQYHSNPNHHHHLPRDKLQDSKKKTMKDFPSCFGKHSVQVADVGCSRSSSIINRYSFATPSSQSNRCTVTTTYISRLTSQKKEILIQLTWSRNHDGPILTVQMEDQFCDNSHKKLSSRAISIQLSHEKKGDWKFTQGSYTVNLYWDMTLAVFSASPEPISGFHVVMYVNSEFVLLLGEVRKDNLNPLDQHCKEPLAQACLISRKEKVYGLTSYTTKARFHPADKDHKICINFEADKQILSLNVDDKLAVHVTKLKWNFRGSQTIFFEKMMVDIMWNLHGWLCEEDDDAWAGRSAWFMFRARSSLDEWLWQVEDGAMSRSSIFTIEAFKGQD